MAHVLFSLISFQKLKRSKQSHEVKGYQLTSSHLVTMGGTDGCEHSLAPSEELQVNDLLSDLTVGEAWGSGKERRQKSV